MGRLMGIEPTNVGATIRCVNHFATIAMAGVAGIEPTLTVLETAVLPLNYTPIYLWCRKQDLNPQPTDYKSVALPIELFRHLFNYGGLGRNRTADTRIFSPLLYRLSYQAFLKWRSRRESNPRSPA